MIKFNIKTVEARTLLHEYLQKIYQNKRWVDWTKLLSVQIELNRLEDENFKAKELLNEREKSLYNRHLEIRKLNKELGEVKTQNDILTKQLEETEKTIENLTEGMIARCDLCDS